MGGSKREGDEIEKKSKKIKIEKEEDSFSDETFNWTIPRYILLL